MEIGIGHLGWSPEQFWDSTHKELLCGMYGKNPQIRENAKKEAEKEQNRKELMDWLDTFDENGDPL